MPNDEISDLLTQIVKLERKVSDLTLLTQHLFALVHQTQRVFEKSHAGAILFSIRRIEARSIIVSEVCVRYS